MEIKSDLRVMRYGLTILMAIWGISYIIISIVVKSVALLIIGCALGLYVVNRWVMLGRTYILSEKGCTIKFFNVSKFYPWDFYDWKIWNDYPDVRLGSKAWNAPVDVYKNGIVFSKNLMYGGQRRRPGLALQRHPFSNIFLYIWTPEVEKIRNESDAIYPSCYEVRRKEILEKMKLWKIRIENMPDK